MSQFLTQIFPTPLLSGKTDSSEILEKICKLAYEFRDNATDAGLVSQGWDDGARSSDRSDFDEYGVTSFYTTNLLREEAWQEVAQFIYEFASTMIGDVYTGERITLLHMWTSVYPKGAYVPEHVHDNNLLSGCFYAKAKPNCGNIVFTDPSYVAKTMATRGTNVFPTVDTKFTFPVEEGAMVIFPSWLPHHTQVNRSDDDRIIVSFNIGFAPHEEPTTEDNTDE